MKVGWVHPRRCLLDHPIRAGELRRTFAPAGRPTPLIAYDVGCPACGFRNLWRHGDDVRFVEGPMVSSTATVELPSGAMTLGYWHPSTITATPAMACVRCGKTIVIAGEEITAA